MSDAAAVLASIMTHSCSAGNRQGTPIVALVINRYPYFGFTTTVDGVLKELHATDVFHPDDKANMYIHAISAVKRTLSL